MKTRTHFALFAAGVLICLTALMPNSPIFAHLDEAATTQVYLPILFSRLPATATPTRTPSPTPTKTPTPAPVSYTHL
ncbi:MAG: hypothetical protein KIH69_010995, partial [Anaerolineae bacterium]|nr:hypothetical protein [Anaerolineae bacterium]